jgi:hypothetical protein
VAWNHYHLRGAMRRVLNETNTPADEMLVRLAIGANNSSAVQLVRMADSLRRRDPEVPRRLHNTLSSNALANLNTEPERSQSMQGLPAASAQDAEQRRSTLSTIAPTLDPLFQKEKDRNLKEKWSRKGEKVKEGTGDYNVGLDLSGHGSANVTPVNRHAREEKPDELDDEESSDRVPEESRLLPFPRTESKKSLAPRRPTESSQQAESKQPSSNRGGIASSRSSASLQQGGIMSTRSRVSLQRAESGQSSSTQSTRRAGSSQSPSNRALQSAEAGQSSSTQSTRRAGSSQSPSNRALQSAEAGQSSSTQPTAQAQPGQSSADQGQQQSWARQAANRVASGAQVVGTGLWTGLQNTAAGTPAACRIS